MTRDPTADGRNWYVYVQNEPTIDTDPTGYQNKNRGRGGSNKGRGDDPLYDKSNEELQGMLDDKKNPVDSKTKQKIIKIQKEKKDRERAKNKENHWSTSPTAEYVGNTAKVGAIEIVGYLAWEGLKWGVAIGGAPESGGLSLAAAAALP